MLTTESATIQIQSDGKIVWVNSISHGGAIGRFGRNGIDVHTEDTTGCLHCTHEPTTREDWSTFVQKMEEHHDVPHYVLEMHKPDSFAA